MKVSNSDVALVTERFQIIVVVPASKLVTTTIPGDDMIDFNAAPWWADPAMLTPPLIPASDQLPGKGPIVVLAIPAATSVATPSPAPFWKWTAATPTMPLSWGNERACQDDAHV